MEALREVTLLSICIRILLAVVIGGLIGLERGLKNRPAGLRTYMTVCLGACLIMLTNHYIYQVTASGDPVRMGAQVVSGIGFLGAGTIIVTQRQRVKGLTTAAGLWSAAIIGLTLGAGFYEGGLLATLLILLAELLFSKLEYRMLDNAPEINLYMEYTGKTCLEHVLRLYRELDLKLLDMEITRNADGDKITSCAIFTLRLNKKCKADWLLGQLHAIKGIVLVEEL